VSDTEGGEARFNRAQLEQWRAEFPYHWDADELVSRRELLQFAVYTSGALFASTALLALLGGLERLQNKSAMPVVRIATTAELPSGKALYFNYPGPADQAILLHLPKGNNFVAYSQRCTHLSCAVYFQPEHDRLYCPCHDGVFDPQTGAPIAGPPQRRLGQIALRLEGDVLYAIGLTA
jgi:Rieske Fe-S protein